MPRRCASATPRQPFDELGRPPRRPGRPVEPPVQAAALEVLQLEVGEAVGLSDVVDLHDVGMLQAGDGLRLGQESGAGLGAGMATAQDHLQDAGAIQADLPGAVDDSHPAAAQLTQDLVARDGRGGGHSVGALRRAAAVAGLGTRVGPSSDRRSGREGRVGRGA